MHTKKFENGTKIHYNSDLSGEVIIVAPQGDPIVMEGEDLLNFVAEHIVSQRLAELEDMPPLEALKVLTCLKS